MTAEVREILEQTIGILEHEVLYVNHRTQSRAEELIRRMRSAMEQPRPEITYDPDNYRDLALYAEGEL